MPIGKLLFINFNQLKNSQYQKIKKKITKTNILISILYK